MRTRNLVPVPLSDGTELRLRADVNALCDFEVELVRTGLDPVRELGRIEAGVGATFTGMRALIWACARGQHAGLRVDHVGTLMGSDGDALRRGVLDALTAAAPQREDGEKGDDQGKTTPPSA